METLLALNACNETNSPTVHHFDTTNSCENCKTEINCKPLYNALKILEHTKDISIEDYKELKKLQTELQEMGFSYPDGKIFCCLATDTDHAVAMAQRTCHLMKHLYTRLV